MIKHRSIRVKQALLALIAIAGIVFQAQAQERCKQPCVTPGPEESVDAKLNRTYRDIMHKIESGGFDGGLVPKEELSQSLRQSQRAWLKFRDDNCEAYYTLMSGGLSRNEDREICLGVRSREEGVRIG
ncbi:lysozyme inhibitor LprI family protein [Pseudomonas luteola]|uniref:lysozyme inhibitor LprI family protein n=2 Tax=Pseudomonas luteola TaxID=47886 RepID=UPI00123B2E02|nr:DUF1311 domain-containing protein [Pseudomonas luteola]